MKTGINLYHTYTMKPLLIDAEFAHEQAIIVYDAEGNILLNHSEVPNPVHITKDHQFSLIRPTYDDLSKALSSTANSPIIKGQDSLRIQFDKEFENYDFLAEKAYDQGLFEPNYGTYVFDQVTGNLYLIAPEFWHRLGLVTNNSKLATDPEKKLSWQEIRNIFDTAVIGFVGASVGGNILEGAMREIRPKTAKIADHDWVEISNLNRLERGSLFYMVASRANKFDSRNPFEVIRINKAEVAIYEQHLLDPYANWFVYKEGLDNANVKQFLLGDGNEEPPVTILVEECDDLRLKVELRRLCRQYGIPVLMLSDFGHLVQVQYQDFHKNKKQSLGYDNITDEKLLHLLNAAMTSGKREDRFSFIKALCGPEFEADEFGDWVRGIGEQPTSSLPQSGATAMTSGGVGGKLLALFLLGYPLPKKTIFDLKNIVLTKEL